MFFILSKYLSFTELITKKQEHINYVINIIVGIILESILRAYPKIIFLWMIIRQRITVSIQDSFLTFSHTLLTVS
jgi:hypothetical protein